MRNLTSVQSTTDVIFDAEFQLTASDQSTTFIFDKSQVETMPEIEWEVEFAGGFGKTSNYNITIISSLDFIKENLTKFVNGETNLKINVNSDTFYPHVGRVRSIRRNSNLPGRVTFDVYDKFLDDKKRFPVIGLVDSYDSLNPEVIEDDWGTPVYYGENIRPYYHVAVDCGIRTILPPINISSENQVNSFFYNSDLKLSDATSAANVILTNHIVRVDSTIVSSFDFSLNDLLRPMWEFDTTQRERFGFTLNDYDQIYFSRANVDNYNLSVPESINVSAIFRIYDYQVTLSNRINKNVERVNYVSFTSVFSNVPASAVDNNMQMGVDSGQSQIAVNLSDTDSSTNRQEFLMSTVPTIEDLWFIGNKPSYFFPHVLIDSNAALDKNIMGGFSLNLDISISPSEYENYSIYSFPVNTSDISISENPFGIMDDIFDQSSIDFVQDQSSDAQVDVSSFKFQCYFGERQVGQKIYQEFGELTNTNLWVADSGSINYRTYQNSANATVNKSLTLDDIQTFEILENPIGTTRYRTRKANEVEVRYNYDYQKRTYLNAQVNNKNNNAFCDSADASGIKNKIIEKTKYIIDSATASFFLDNLTKKVTQDEEFVNLSLPPKFLELELTDVIQVEHPMIVGSQSTYQIVQISQDYNTGTTRLTARELIE